MNIKNYTVSTINNTVSCNQFKLDIAREFGLTSHPKFERCYTLAWEHGFETNGLLGVCYSSSNDILKAIS